MSAEPSGRPQDRRGAVHRLSWFVGIWAASVAVVTIVAYGLRSLLPG